MAHDWASLHLATSKTLFADHAQGSLSKDAARGTTWQPATQVTTNSSTSPPRNVLTLEELRSRLAHIDNIR
jgi:hypothetical protein